jgi:hypothetical protein
MKGRLSKRSVVGLRKMTLVPGDDCGLQFGTGVNDLEMFRDNGFAGLLAIVGVQCALSVLQGMSYVLRRRRGGLDEGHTGQH